MNEDDPRVKRTRKLIVDAFFALLAEKRLHAISVQDIAERATVNRATFYLHFEDKYALIDWVARDMFRQALMQRLGTTPRFSLDNLRLLVATVCELLSQYPGHCAPEDRSIETQLQMKMQEELATFLLGWLQQAPLARREDHADGLAGPADVTPQELAALMSWAIFGAGFEWSLSERRRPVQEWASDVVDTLVGGVARVVALPGEKSLSPQVGRSG
jgi:AcrR family transcriptional regulator